MTAPPAAPIESTATVTVYQIPDAPYRLRKPLLLEIERDEAGFVVSDPSTGVFHYDPDFGAAISAFLRVFLDEFEFLRSHEPELSEPLLAELDRFRRLLLPADK